MAEEPAFQNKTLSGDAALRRTFGRQKIWLVVGLMTSAMLLMCTSVALLQRRFDLAGYFRHSPAAVAAAAAAAAEDSSRQPANASQRSIQNLERELRDARSQTTSQFELSTRLPHQLKSRRRFRVSSGMTRIESGLTRVTSTTKRAAAAARDILRGEPRQSFRDTTAIDISHELEFLRGSFGERPLEIDAPEAREGLDSKHDTHEPQISTGTTLVERLDQEHSKGESPKISLESQSNSSNTSQPPRIEAITSSRSGSTTPLLRATVSISNSTTSTSEQFMEDEKQARRLNLAAATVPSDNHSTFNKHIRMLKRRRRVRVRVTIPASKTHSSFRNQTVAVGKNLTNELSAKTTVDRVETKKEVYEAPHVLNDVKGKLSSNMNPAISITGYSTTTGSNTSFASMEQTSTSKPLKINSRISPSKEITLHPLTKESRPENMTESFQSLGRGAPTGGTLVRLVQAIETKAATDIAEENFTTYEKTLSPHQEIHSNTSNLVSSTTNLRKHDTVKGISELFVGHSGPAPSETKLLVTLTSRNGTAPVTTTTGIVNSTVHNMSTTQNASVPSPESSHDVKSPPKPVSVYSTRAPIHDADNEQSRLPKYNETSADANNFVDVVAEEANKTAEDVLNKILEKAMNDKREIAKNLTGNRGGASEVTSPTQEDVYGRVTWDDGGNYENSSHNVMPVTASYASRADSRAFISTHMTVALVAPSQPSRSTQPSTAQPSVKEASTVQTAVESPIKEASPQESLKSSRTTSSPYTTASTPQEPVEEVVPLAEATPTGPPDEIVPEVKAISGVPSSETASPETTTNAGGFAYYTGKDEWIPGESARFIDRASRYGKILPGHLKAKAALSYDDLGNKKEWPASTGRSHRFVDAGEGGAHYGNNSERLHTKESATENTASNQRQVADRGEEEAMRYLYSSLKSAVRDESKNRLSESNDEMPDYGIQQPDSGVEQSGLPGDHSRFATGGAATVKRSQGDGRSGMEAVADFTYAGEESSERAMVSAHSGAYDHNKGSNKSRRTPEPFVIDGSDEGPVGRTFERRTTTTKLESREVAVTLVVKDTKSRQTKLVTGLTPLNDATGNEKMAAKLSPEPVKRMPGEENLFTSFTAESNRTNSSEVTITPVRRREHDEDKTTLQDSTSNPLKNELDAAEHRSSEHPNEAPFLDDLLSDRTNAGKEQSVTRTEFSTLQSGFKLEGERPSVEREREIFTRTEERKPSTVQNDPPTFSTGMTRKVYPRIEENNVDWRSTVVESGEDVVSGVDTKSSLVNQEITEIAKSESSAAPKRFSEPTGGAVEQTKETSRKTVSLTADSTRPGVLCVYRRNHAGWQSGNMSYNLESVLYEYCSSVLYCCLSLRQDLAIEDVGNNTDFNYLAKVKASNPGLETYVVIEANESTGGIFQKLLSKTVHQDIFVLLAVHWMRARKIGGAYLYWRQMEDKDGDELSKLYRYLHDSFDKSNLTFGVILPPGTRYFATASALEALVHDLGGSSGRILLAPPEMEDSAFISTISDHAELIVREYNRYPKSTAGASASVCPMIPFWGKAFKMQAVLQDTGLALKPAGRGSAGVVTQEAGKLAFFEFCGELGKSQFVLPTREHIIIGNEYMTFLTPMSLEKHLTSMVSHSSWQCFGSWGPEWDDFAGHCGLGRFPLLRTLYEFQVNRTLNLAAEVGIGEAGDS